MKRGDDSSGLEVISWSTRPETVDASTAGPPAADGPGERLYLHDDEAFGIVANRDQTVIDRHVGRYRKALKLLDGVHVRFCLDLGCGSGYGSEILSEHMPFVVGCDADAGAIHYATKHHRSKRPPWSPWFWCWNHIGIHAALHRANAFPDAVVCIETLEHLTALDQSLCVANVAALLSNAPNPKEAVFVVACPLGSSGPNPRNPYHLHEPTLVELEQLLGRWFERVEQDSMDQYESTAGETTTQAWYRCQIPNR